MGKHVIEERYGNLFQMYEKIVDENPYETPMMIYPAIHYCMGGIWVDYELHDQHSGLVLHWGMQFFRSRRKPAWGFGTDAGIG
ncbi:MAG: hypothetical protein MZV63_03310 [Marinilabiliales bacterium]|nr:hypothetical protein [Marinilabiliales bacterium]